MILDPRTSLAVATAAVIPAAVAGLASIFFLWAQINPLEEIEPAIEAIGRFSSLSALVGFAVSSIACLLIGVPIHLMLHWFGIRALWWYLLIASGISIGFASYFLDIAGSDPFALFILTNLASGGPVAAIAFWWVARPDKRQT